MGKIIRELNNYSTFIFLLLIFIFNSVIGQQVKITRSDGEADEYFGNSVAVHGDYAIVGAYFDDDNGWGSGSAYIFKKEADIWNQKQKLLPSGVDDYDFFGTSVSIYNDLAVIGSTGDNGSGSVYVFRKSGESWNEEAVLIPSNGSSGDLFGTSVSVYNEMVAVGAAGDDINTGSVYIFEKEGTSWEEKQYIYASDGINYDYFGSAVALDDVVLAVGVKGYLGTGGVYVYIKDGNTWENVSKIRASDNGAEDQFGATVSVSQNFIAAGARFEDEGGIDCGAAYIFVRAGNSWSELKKIIPTDGIENERFGKVAIDGNILAIGANNDDDLGLESGSVYIYQWNGNDWMFNQKLTANDGFAGDGFGSSLFLDGTRVIVGSPNDNDGASDAGSCYVIDLQGITDIQINGNIPTEYSLSQNYPNPFNPSTTIEFAIPNSDEVSLIVYDMLGREVAELVNDKLSAGNYKIQYNAAEKLSSGVYIYRIRTNNYLNTKKLLLIK